MLWDLHSALAVAIRGGTKAQRMQLEEGMAAAAAAASGGTGKKKGGLLGGMVGIPPTKGGAGLQEDEDREICSACWACREGAVAAVGYTDGDVWLWGLPVISGSPADFGLKGKFPSDVTAGVSGRPLAMLSIGRGPQRVPVTHMRWFNEEMVGGKGVGGAGEGTGRGSEGEERVTEKAGEKAGEKTGVERVAATGGRKGVLGGGRLYLFGGGEMGFPEAVTVSQVDC